MVSRTQLKKKSEKHDECRDASRAYLLQVAFRLITPPHLMNKPTSHLREQVANLRPARAGSVSAFSTHRVLIALILCATAYSVLTGTMLAFFRPEAPAKVSPRTLTYAERVAYQRAIEDVYWHHRIWPKERPDPKPSLDAVMSQTQLEKKVEDYLRNSQALEDYWQRPITAEQLQAELDRMAQHTKQPDVLRELFDALGNDPFIIAECLARPALSERLVTNLYAYDQRFHGELRQRTEAEVQMHPSIEQMKQTSGTYSELELVSSDSGQEEGNRGAARSVKLNSREWDQTVQKVAAMFDNGGNDNARTGLLSRAVAAEVRATPKSSEGGSPAEGALIGQIKTGVLSPLQEDEGRYYATAVVEKTKDHLKLATVSWRKEPFESWIATAESQVPIAVAAPDGNYALPKISEGGCIDDTWAATSGPPDSRRNHTAVWTGSEMIVWGGLGFGAYLNTGGRYNPSTDNWTVTSSTNAPTARGYHTAVWTGSEMIVWGGRDESVNYFNTGGRYNPITDTWTATSTANAPTGRYDHTAVWTGGEMIVWGGAAFGPIYLNTGGRYNPSTNSWTPTSTNSAPAGRELHAAVWTGSEMIVWGGYDGFNYLNTGGRYNPTADSWTATSSANAPTGRWYHTAVWTGSEMIVWGGQNYPTFLNTGARYNPGTDTWTATSTTNAPSVRAAHAAVWSGNEMIVWGGYDEDFLNTGGRYTPGTDSWIATSTTNAPTSRELHTAIWTGSEMIVWGGEAGIHNSNTGGKYNPSMDSWADTGVNNAPSARSVHTAVWTGSEMIVWGGYYYPPGDVWDTGGRYNAAIDSWTPTSTTNAPDVRYVHTAVWTGSEMIIWGGSAFNYIYLNTGGRYNPTTDSWMATSITNAPIARWLHTAVWTGSEMVVWGGYGDSGEFNTGGRYNPITDSWIATSTINAPVARASHTSVWTGSEMIVWGGWNGPDGLNSGGRYDPVADGWIATSTANALAPRSYHTAVWTGSEMIVWGGYNEFTAFNTGGRYNPSTDSWRATRITNAPSPRFSHTTIWTGTEMIVWGGTNYVGDRFNTGGRYNPDRSGWTATSSNGPISRSNHTAVWTGSEMIVWGGYDGFNYLNTGDRYCAQAGPTPTPTPTPGPIVLSAAGRKVGGINTVRLTWSGATSTNIEVYRNNVLIRTVPNTGAYTDSTGDTGRARYTYRVCEAGTQTCSNNARVTFRQ